MDVFDLNQRIVDRYASYVRSFFTIREPRTKEFVDDYLDGRALWPEPLVQLNPSFEPASTVKQLVADGVLHPECANIFRRGKSETSDGEDMVLHWHQSRAIEVASTNASYVLTTGTGSGKSLAYFIPIINHVLNNPSKKRIRAIVVYPMNALANSQENELKKFLHFGYTENNQPVTFARYTGQENDEARKRIQANPPDILLTNFMMLELILTRPEESGLIDAAHDLEFLVLDELHTYRGRQGADVAMLVRRVRERCGSTEMRCVGTSATIAGSGTLEQRQEQVADVATRLFGQHVDPAHAIQERVRQAITRSNPTKAELRQALEGPATGYPTDFPAFAAHPLAAWAEKELGLQQDEKGRLERRKPETISDVARRLAEFTGIDWAHCAEHLRAVLMAGYETKHPDTGLPVFAFRLHQLISRGDRVFATLEAADSEHRHITAEEQRFAPGDEERRLYPLAFCRECGAEYAVVMRDMKNETVEPRELNERADGDDIKPGYLYMDAGRKIQLDTIQLVEDWVEIKADGFADFRSGKKALAPAEVWIRTDGKIIGEAFAAADHTAIHAWWFPAPFRYCMHCKVTFQSERERDFGKLAELSTEGRSTATTILSLTTVAELRQDKDLDIKARKLLSFTDNRQDASLQAGHFNDFVQVSLVRAALFAALAAAGEQGLTHEDIAHETFKYLGLDFSEYAADATVKYQGETSTKEALRWVIGYLLYNDLRRGWRVNSPNLEQVGLLNIEYASLVELCANEDDWQGTHEVLQKAAPEVRFQAAQAVLDFMRRDLQLEVRYLEAEEQDRIKQRSEQWLCDPWRLERDQRLNVSGTLLLARTDKRDRRRVLGPNSTLGRYLRRGSTWKGVRDYADKIEGGALGEIAGQLMDRLVMAGIVERSGPDDAPAYRVKAGALRWKVNPSGQPRPDPVRAPDKGTHEGSVNEFFREFYQTLALQLHGLVAHEHTAQVPHQTRIDREDDFREGVLPVLYCSPTMELGVDIADLNAVHLRNAPPTPANYAQRSGRAGRQGQPAVVYTYCTSGSPHDQYYFKHRADLVSGQVQPPRLDLVNPDLLRAHVQAIWLAETRADLHNSLTELLDLGDRENLPLKTELNGRLADPGARLRAQARAKTVLSSLADELQGTAWYGDDWLSDVMNNAHHEFDQACSRWRGLFRAADEQIARQNLIMQNHTISAEERRNAKRLRDEAETQLDLLINSRAEEQTDFYSYRYFASEGFLPGYNFPRLPLSAFLPGRQEKTGRPNFVSRARFLAVSEFGPRSIIYHEGSRFRVTRVLSTRRERPEGHLLHGKVCRNCGYGHFGAFANADICAQCGHHLHGTEERYFDELMQLTNVATRRVDRITCDEEERLRIGYEIETAYRFGGSETTPRRIRVDFNLSDGQSVVEARYAQAATLWRINLGWRARKNKDELGFYINMDTGDWGKSDLEQAADDNEKGPAPKARIERVVPFVEDRRNVLLLRLQPEWLDELMAAVPAENRYATLSTEDRRKAAQASVQFALKRGIEALYQIEDMELAAEPLPTASDRREILFYEAAEGGAGVLARIAQEADALAKVAAEALRICHFDPVTGDAIERPDSREECVAGCYDCLLSYSNQPDHTLLDRALAKPVLMALTGVRALRHDGGITPSEQYAALRAKCHHVLEQEFLSELYGGRFDLPNDAHPAVREAHPDFYYAGGTQALVYVDGGNADGDGRSSRDASLRAGLEEAGLEVIRLGAKETWPEALKKFHYVFGEGKS